LPVTDDTKCVHRRSVLRRPCRRPKQEFLGPCPVPASQQSRRPGQLGSACA
jgi:hypothetical protein